jgi:trans-aconitate methyltransferase
MEPNCFVAGYQPYWEYRWESPGGGNGSSTDGEGAAFYHNFVRNVVECEDIKTMMDVGCGALNQWPAKCPVDESGFTGTDVSENALKRAQVKWPGAKFVRLDATQAPTWQVLPESDLVTCSDMLIHIPHQDFPMVISGILLVAKKAVVIRMWTNPPWDGLAGYHWSHELPQRQGWTLKVYDTPDNAAPWKLHYYRKD